MWCEVPWSHCSNAYAKSSRSVAFDSCTHGCMRLLAECGSQLHMHVPPSACCPLAQLAAVLWEDVTACGLCMGVRRSVHPQSPGRKLAGVLHPIPSHCAWEWGGWALSAEGGGGEPGDCDRLWSCLALHHAPKQTCSGPACLSTSQGPPREIIGIERESG